MRIKNLHKQVIVLGVISLFTDIASEMLYPVTPIFLTSVIGASMASVGLIEGLAEVTAGFLKGYFGAFSDKIGKRSIFIVLGYGVSALSKPLPGIFPKFVVVLSSRVVDRIGKGVRTAPRDALLASYSNNNTGEVFGFHRAMDTFGAALGPVIALILMALLPGNFTIIYLIAFIPSAFAVLFTLMVKDKAIVRESKDRPNFSAFWKSAPMEYKKFIALFTIFSLVNSSDVFLILKSRDISSSDVIAISGYIVYNLVYAASSYPAGILSDKMGKKKILFAGMIIFSLVYLGFAFSENIILMFILFGVYGIYASFTEGVSKALVSDLIPDHFRGSAIGLLTMLSGFAILLGSTLTGFLWDRFGSAVPFVISSAISLIVAVNLWSLKSGRK